MKLAELFPLTEAVIKPWSKRALLSTTSYTEEELNKAADTLIKYCPGFLPALKNGGILFRGDYDLDKFTYMDSSTGIRTSKDTNNFYQLMMEISEPLNNAGIPHRSKSLICSSSLASALAYGAASVVIPVGKNSNSDVAYAFYKDFLNTRVNYLGPLFDDKHSGSHFLDYLNLQLSKFSDEIYSAPNKLGANEIFVNTERKKHNTSLIELEQKIAAEDVDYVLNAWLRAVNIQPDTKLTNDIKSFIEKNHHNFLHALASEIFTMDTLALGTVKYGDAIPTAKECWFSGKAFLVPRELFAKIVDEVKVRGHEVSYGIQT